MAMSNSAPTGRERRRHPPQYSLASLLWLTFAVAVLCSSVRTWGDNVPKWLLGATVGFCLPILLLGPMVVVLAVCLCRGMGKRFLVGIALTAMLLFSIWMLAWIGRETDYCALLAVLVPCLWGLQCLIIVPLLLAAWVELRKK